MDESQQQMNHHVGVLSKYLQYQQQMLQETRDMCNQVVTTAASLPVPRAQGSAATEAKSTTKNGGGNVFTKMFKFGDNENKGSD